MVFNRSSRKFLSLLFLPAFCVVLFLLFFPDSIVTATSPDSLGFSTEELAWMEAHPVVRLAPDPDFPPIEFLDEHGNYLGIAADFISLLEKKLPIRFEIVLLKNWNEVIRQAKSREIDMFGAAVPTPERLKYMRFTPPYVEFPAVVLVRDSAENFPTLSQLKGKRVAVVSNYADHEYMVRAYPHIPLEVMPDISSGLRQVSFGKVDAMVLNLASASYYIQKDGISNLKVTEDTDFVFDLSFATRSDWPELNTILEKGMAAISPEEKKTILDSWISLGNPSWKPSLLVVISAFAIIMVFSLMIILNWNRLLQRQVRERTADLENELAERILAEKEKEKLQQQVHRAKKMEALGLLAGGVAHDLNNILSGAVGYSDLAMRKVPKDSALLTYFREIRESGRRAAAVVADLLTISRDAASDRQVTNLNAVIQEYLDSAEHQALVARYNDMAFKVDLDPDLANLSCSVIHMKKSLMNLVLNAAEATQLGTVVIGTRNRVITAPLVNHDDIKPGPFVQLFVTDTGPGIAAEDLEHIFEPFYTRKKLGHSGTGLGLSVVWNTVQEHHGFIDVSQPERGTHFELNFPATVKTTADPLLPLDETELQGRGEHILVVDDDENIRRLAEGMLVDLGYRVSAVASGEEAVAFLRQQPADLIVLDMLMEPGMNGYQAFSAIRSFLPDQKAVIASGFSESKNVKQAQALGAGAYIKKPYTVQELGLAVKNELLR